MTNEKNRESIPVVVTDPDGFEREFVEEAVIPFAGKHFVVLVSIPDSMNDEEEPDIILAKMIINEQGETEYIAPSDDEFEAVASIYEKM